MGEMKQAKPGRALRTIPLVSQSLAALWMGGDRTVKAFDDRVDALFRSGSLDAEFAAAAAALQADDLQELQSALRRAASNVLLPASLRDGADGALDGELFFLPLHGPKEGLEAMVGNPEALDALASTFLDSGIAAPGSNLVLVAALIEPLRLALASPTTVRNLALALTSAAATGDTAAAGRAVTEMLLATGGRLDTDVPDDAMSTFGTWLLPGVRMAVVSGPDNLPDDYLGGVPPGDDPNAWHASCAAWDQQVADLVSRTGSAVLHELPGWWDDALGAAARLHVYGAMSLETSLYGASQEAPAAIHVTMHTLPDGGAEFHVVKHTRAHVLGPVRVAFDLVAPDVEGFLEALADDGEVQLHPGIAVGVERAELH